MVFAGAVVVVGTLVVDDGIVVVTGLDVVVVVSLPQADSKILTNNKTNTENINNFFISPPDNLITKSIKKLTKTFFASPPSNTNKAEKI